MKQLRFLGFIICLVFLAGCASNFLKNYKGEKLKKNKEFEAAVKIERVQEPEPSEEESPESVATPATPVAPASPSPRVGDLPKGTLPSGKNTSKGTSQVKATPAPKGSKTPAKKASATAPAKRQPDIEDSQGFEGRRPLVDPFWIGEEVVHDVHYFKVSAGELRMKVEPFAMVNGRKSYSFAIEIRTSALFSKFHSVEDRVETLVDYEDLVPRVFELHVKESDKVAESKMLFDIQNNKATFWERKVTKKEGEVEKKLEWDILPFSQNVYSAVFYMRNFTWEPGKEISFRVANEQENLVFSGKALKREVLNTRLGPIKAIKIQPKIVLKGKFKPIGDNFIWISDDEHRYILRIESKIKIGTLVSEVVEIRAGKKQ